MSRTICLQADDEEALREEEEEALAIQRKAAEELRNQDLGAESSSGEEAEDFEAEQVCTFQLLDIHPANASSKCLCLTKRLGSFQETTNINPCLNIIHDILHMRQCPSSKI